ncbi:MAG: hypothetical protein JXA69_15885 [Phycisphaerae bacterium]|nr:hypothetical protein [Phycisphaerae bacterium]
MQNVTANKPAAALRWPRRAVSSLFRAGSASVFVAITASLAAGQVGPNDTVKARLPSVQQMAEAQTDVWGEAAARLPDGASYTFFRDLLPPLLYVNTDFRYYPLMLSAPRSDQKARLVSNGSAVNPRANETRMWSELGTPVTFHVGKSDEPFGHDFPHLDGPRYLDGYLPVVQMSYPHNGIIYREEAFAPVEPPYAQRGTLMVRFTGSGPAPSRVRARIRSDENLHAEADTIRDEAGNVVDPDSESVATPNAASKQSRRTHITYLLIHEPQASRQACARSVIEVRAEINCRGRAHHGSDCVLPQRLEQETAGEPICHRSDPSSAITSPNS